MATRSYYLGDATGAIITDATGAWIRLYQETFNVAACDIVAIEHLETTADIGKLETTAHLTRLNTTANLGKLETTANIEKLETTINIRCS